MFYAWFYWQLECVYWDMIASGMSKEDVINQEDGMLSPPSCDIIFYDLLNEDDPDYIQYFAV